MTVADVEEWRPIAGYPNYEVSSFGRVRSRSKSGEARMLKPRVYRGYSHVMLCAGGRRRQRRVHRLVLEAFVGPCPPGMMARHVVSNDRCDNRLANLAWGTHAENMLDRASHGSAATGDKNGSRRRPERLARGERNGASNMKEADVISMRAAFDSGESAKSIAQRMGIGYRHAWCICTRRTWKHVA